MLTYTAAYYHCPEDGWYTCKVLDFPGVISQGRSLDGARRMLCDALREMGAWLIEDGLPLPKPDPTATDEKATLIEPITLTLKAKTGAGSS